MPPWHRRVVSLHDMFVTAEQGLGQWSCRPATLAYRCQVARLDASTAAAGPSSRRATGLVMVRLQPAPPGLSADAHPEWRRSPDGRGGGSDDAGLSWPGVCGADVGHPIASPTTRCCCRREVARGLHRIGCEVCVEDADLIARESTAVSLWGHDFFRAYGTVTGRWQPDRPQGAACTSPSAPGSPSSPLSTTAFPAACLLVCGALLTCQLVLSLSQGPVRGRLEARGCSCVTSSPRKSVRCALAQGARQFAGGTAPAGLGTG